MDVIEKARELGALIQEDARYINYCACRDANDADANLQQLIGDFNLLRLNLNNQMSGENRDMDKLKEIDAQIKEKYNEIMANENMIAYNNAKDKLDEMLNMINNIITASANGEDPKTCDAQPSGCTGSCSSCSGCH
ncbi:MAG: YlbF family regulator [Oscillospiraceae bacterium]|nr:YlbF family regulator [Oscillospiraceae bacterium]